MTISARRRLRRIANNAAHWSPVIAGGIVLAIALIGVSV